MEIICDTDYQKLSRIKLFHDWYAAYDSTAKHILAQLSPFDLIFDELLVSQRAIIIKTGQSEKLNAIRANLLANMSLPADTKTPPDITHSTLARFTRPLNLQQVIDKVGSLRISATQHVTVFSLVKDLGPPIFNGEPMESYQLESL